MINFRNIVVLILFLIASKYAFTATSGSILLRGIVPSVLNVSIISNGANSLDLESNAVDSVIGYVNTISNNANGYKISFDSLNNGKLVNGDSFLVYTLKYGNIGLDLSGVSEVNKTSLGLSSEALKISYTGVDYEQISAGTYEDTVTVSIVAN